jgi:hypothetical protein
MKEDLTILLLAFIIYMIIYMKAIYQDKFLYKMICMLGMNVLTLAIFTLGILLIFYFTRFIGNVFFWVVTFIDPFGINDPTNYKSMTKYLVRVRGSKNLYFAI